MADHKSEYKGIFKSTFLFGFVQVVRLLVSLIRNKIVALLLGPNGMGVIGIYNNTINMIKTGAGLGISQSAVKDVSEANASGQVEAFSRTISLTHKLVFITSLFGLFVTILLSPLLSKISFNNYQYTIPFIVLSLAVAFDILVDNQLAILKGMRRLRSLAYASMLGAVAALMTGVPLFFLFREKGIVPSIIISAVATAVVSTYYVRRIKYKKVSLTMKEVWKEGFPMIKMGSSMMTANFLSFFFNMLVLAFIQNMGGLIDVGLYNAGSVLVVSYFSMVTTALNTDYYPRIAAVNKDNVRLQVESDQQSRAGLILVFPLVILFVFLAPIAIDILYSSEFVDALKYTDWAILGIVISVVSNCLGYILIVKQEAKLYFIIAVLFNTVSIPLFWGLYYWKGLTGLGMAYAINVLAQLIIYFIICKKRYNIGIGRRVLIELVVICGLTIVTAFVRKIDDLVLSYSIGALLIMISTAYSLIVLKKEMNIDILSSLMNRIKNKKLVGNNENSGYNNNPE